MAERSHVTSVDAIEAFRSAVIVFLSKARPALEEISSEVMRLGLWLENDQREHWIKEIKILTRRVEEAQQELFGARLSRLQQPTAAQQMALHRARRELRAAQEKQAITRKWDRDLENRTQPLLKEVSQLHTFLTTDMARAVQYLDQVVKALEAYADVVAPGSSAASVPASAADKTSPASKPAAAVADDTPSTARGKGDRA